MSEWVPGFEVADCTGVFKPIKADIVAEDQIRLIAVPGAFQTVRYAYEPYAKATTTLRNSDGLPAAPVVLEIDNCGIIH